MKTLYCDASFDPHHTIHEIGDVVRGKIAISGEGLNLVEKLAIGKVPNLKQYINIFELVAIARAVEIAAQREWNKDAGGGSLQVFTDSQVAVAWASSGKTNPRVFTVAHGNALEYLRKSKIAFGGIVTFTYVPRDRNPAGHLLSAELKRESPHAI